MKKAIIGKKVGMTQIFDEAGKVVPVTVIEAGPCVVVQKKTVEKEGYASVQLGYEDIAERKLSKPEKGHLEKAGTGMKKHLKEFRLEDSESMNVGDVVKADVFKEGDKVDVTGISASALSAPPPATAAALSTVMRAQWARPQHRPVSSKDTSGLDTWAATRPPYRIWTWLRLTPS